MLQPNGNAEVTLKLVSSAPSGWLDRVFGASVPPIALTHGMPDVSESTLLDGEIVRLRRLRPGT